MLLPGLIPWSMIDGTYYFSLTVLKTLGNLGFLTQQARERAAPWTETSVYHSYYLLLKLDKLGFQPSKQGRQELPGLIFQSMIVYT